MAVRLNPLTHDYGWNEPAGRYIDLATGRFVSSRLIVAELEKVIDACKANIDTISAALQNSEITLMQWQAQMMAQIKTIHCASAAAAKGGWAQMSQSDWGRVGAEIKAQYQWLNKFASQIASGKVRLDGRFRQRARMYGEAGRGTYEEMRRRMARTRGAVEERRVLSPMAEHCTDAEDLSGCVTLADMGWRPVGDLPRIGQAPCRTFCKCYFEFRDATGRQVL